jgi:hypothetical protein
MEALTVDTLPSVASHDETVRCLLAIELSKKSWIVATWPRPLSLGACFRRQALAPRGATLAGVGA